MLHWFVLYSKALFEHDNYSSIFASITHTHTQSRLEFFGWEPCGNAQEMSKILLCLRSLKEAA